jgi:glyoxylase-like metal-dependent hydrolase (beta-lactamase superfamily II)
MAPSRRALEQIGDGLYAYLQPGGGWGWSNAGLIVDGDMTLLVDTLFDLRLTADMLEAIRRAVPSAGEIDALVNTHANGDHTFGNQLLGDARVIASAATAAEMLEAPPSALAGLKANAAELGRSGEFLLECFGEFEFEGIELRTPDETFAGELSLTVGDKHVQLLEVGPAHTRGDILVLVAGDRVVYSGDILFNKSHPVVWAGPIGNWIDACDRILALDVEVVVPGHGELAAKHEVEELKAYLEYLLAEAQRRHEAGMPLLEAARDIALDRWAAWGEPERVVVNVAAAYRELGAEVPSGTLPLFALMAQLAGR